MATIGEREDEFSLLPFVTNLEYNKSMVVMQMDYANFTTQLWDFDNRKRISRIRIASATIEDHFGSYDGGTTVDAKEYDAKADLYPEDNPDGRINGPDYLQALIELEGITANGELTFDVESFAYDGNGNRLKLIQNGDEFIYSYGTRNRLERIDLKKEGNFSSVLYAEYTYDENGNTTSRIIYGEEGVETVNFEYDVLNRLVKTVRGDETTEYFYDNAGNRVIKSSSDGSLNLYLRHGAIAVAMDIEVEGDENDQKGSINRYVLSGDLVAGRITRTINADGTRSLEKNYYHLDHLNSTKVVTDEAGEVVVNYTYRAFGEQLRRLDKSNAPTEDLAKYSYGGKELDADINLYYFNARFYDATTGRFINVDSVQDGTNWYVYVSNNPLSFVDPTGLSEIVYADTTEFTDHNMPESKYFNQQQFADEKDLEFSNDFSKTACATTSLLNELSTVYTSLNAEQLTFDQAVDMIDAAIDAGMIEGDNAFVNDWAGAANAMWGSLGLDGKWSFSQDGFHTIVAWDKTGNGYVDHFINSLPGGNTVHDVWDNSVLPSSSIQRATEGLGGSRVLDFNL